MAKPPLKDVQKLLKCLHDTPVDNAGASDEILAKIYAYLLSVSHNPIDNKLHWFCKRADTTTVAAASFLLRLFAYDSPAVVQWKDRFNQCLRGCCDCVRSLERVKVESRRTYFAAFPDTTLKNFYRTFENWELATVQREILSSNWAQLPIVYRALFNWTIFSDSQVQSMLQNNIDRIDGFPECAAPPGALLLLFFQEPKVRQWAHRQVTRTAVVPIPSDQFVGMYKEVLNLVVDLISSASSAERTFALSTDSSVLWQALHTFLRYVPPEMLKNKQANCDVRQAVVGHLHSEGPEFPDILGSLLLLLKRLAKQFWEDIDVEYPRVVFDAIKDNPAFAKLLESDSSEERPRYLAWLTEYIHTIRKHPAFPDILAKTVDFLCREMQHERFRVSRPFTMNTAMLLLNGILEQRHNEDSSMVNTTLSIVNIHSETIVSVAFSPAYNEEKRSNARASARTLISSALMTDIEGVSSTITALCTALADSSNKPHIQNSIPEFSVRAEIWAKIYPALQTTDTDGLAALISTIAHAAHIDKISEKPFVSLFDNAEKTKGSISSRTVLNAINSAIGTFSNGFLDAIVRFGDYNVSTSALDMLQQHGLAKDVMLLLLSPVEQIQAAAKTFVSMAFDIDGRQECFRVLLENLPDAAFEGIVEFLNIYVQFASSVPEACSLSGSLVRCFTDIIEVLCASPAGLLRNSRYLRVDDQHGPAARLLQLWSMMTKSLAVIFKRCPSWSIYFENEEMILWMRDALIFGRDMLAQWRVVEKAASLRLTTDATSTNPRKLSPVGKNMVNSLQSVLPELARWLRLTDEELLHQSFSLIQFLLDVFRDTGVRPSPDGLAKLTKHLESARKDKSKQTTTRLDSSRLSALADAIAYFEDEIEVVSVSVGLKKDVKVVKKEEHPTEPLKIAPSKSSNIQHQQHRVSGQKMTGSRYFTKEDQQRLDASSVMPSFKKTSRVTTSDSKTRTSESMIENKPISQPSSSSESSDEESGEERRGGLAALAKFQKSPKIKKSAERRQVKTLEIAGVGDAVRRRREMRERQEEARRAALRMKPNLAELHKALLSWSYDHVGPMPPGELSSPSYVPDTFKDYNEYRQVFEPLLLMECWAQICQAKDGRPEVYETKIAGRGYVDDWLDLEVGIVGPVGKDWYLGETDVVLLRNADIHKSIMAKTQHYRATSFGIQASLRCYIKYDGDPGLQIGTTWQLSKVFSLSTIHREYAALVSLPYYDFVDMILRPTLPMPPQVNPKDVQNAMSSYAINEPQANAILSSIKSSGFCLIQGPPGTGKTSTICGLVAVFLSRRGRPFEVKGSSVQTPTSKILICAPSNAAIDEIVFRIKEGYRGSKRCPDNAKVVRIGTDKAINHGVKDVSLDALVDKKLNGNTSAMKEKGLGDEVTTVQLQLDEIRAKRSSILNELKNLRDNHARYNVLDEELKKINSQRTARAQRLDQLKDKRKSEFRTLDAIRRKTRLEVLQEADIICSTLSGAGHESLDPFDFDTIVIDEAAQAIEISSLIPLRYKCRRCIMVGDPQQLPPTVISQDAGRYRYNQSLFVRLQKQRPEAVQLLSIQYRMHPEISCLPSQLFYQKKLHDGPDMAVKTKQPWHSHSKFGVYKFFNVGGTEEQSNRSLVNKAECRVAAALFSRLRQEFSFVNLDLRVGVVTMYRAQVVELRRHFEQQLKEKLDGIVDFNTVDGFQGQEKDIIILSCVRGGVNQDTVGFLADTRRMNVALTRAKSSLFILGNAGTLERSNETWAEIIADARSRSCLIDVDTSFFTAPTSSGSVTAAPRKVKPAPTTIPVPTNLVTPKSFKANVDRLKTIPQAGNLDNEASTVGASIQELGNLKRTIEDSDDNSGPALKTSRTIEDPKPALPSRPPLKRTKQPQSIFIPKKKVKC
ncbi:SEN1 N terminal domain containing protein [Amanita muscaria]